MSRIAQAIRDGRLKSAWGDMDEPDSTGLWGHETVVDSEAEKQRAEAWIAERLRAQEAQNAIINAGIEKERREREERAQSDLEEIEGFGTF